MKKSTVSNVAISIDPKSRPFGFIYAHEIQRAKYPSFTGCVELKEGDESTSFFFRVHDLNQRDREYECAFFRDEKYEKPFIQAFVSFVDGHPLTVDAEFFTFDPDWVHFKHDFIGIFHRIMFTGIINAIRPLDSDGRPRNLWIYCFDRDRIDRIQEPIMMPISSIISTTNLLLP